MQKGCFALNLRASGLENNIFETEKYFDAKQECFTLNRRASGLEDSYSGSEKIF